MSAGHGAAWRRRERQLRAWHRHERMTVAMELATALHHSAQRVEAPREGVEGETNDAPRRPKPPLPGKRPAPLEEVAEPQAAQPPLATCVAAGVPSLSSPALGGDCSLDSATVSFLVRLGVGAQAELDRRKRREEEEKAKKAKEAKESSKQFLDQLRAKAWRELEERLDSGGASSKRKRKKRRKRRTPRTSSLPSRARRRQRQWSACYAGLTGYVTPRVMFPSVDARPKMLCIMAGMHQEDSCAVFAGYDAPRSVPSRFHRCSAWTIYWPVVCNDRFSGPGAVLGQVLTCPLLCLTGEFGPDSTKNRGIAAVAVLRRWLTSLLHAATSSCSSRAENSRYAQCKLCTSVAIPQVLLLDKVVVPVVCNDRRSCSRQFRRLVEVPQVQHIITVIHIPVVAQSLIPMALTFQQTIEIPRLQFLDKELICPLLVYTGANCAAPSWRSNTGAALGQGCRARCVHDKCPDPVRRTVQKTVENPLLQFINKVVIIPVGAQRQVPMVSLFSRLLLQYIDKVVDVGCASPASSLVQFVRRQSRSHSCNVYAGHCCSLPVVTQ